MSLVKKEDNLQSIEDNIIGKVFSDRDGNIIRIISKREDYDKSQYKYVHYEDLISTDPVKFKKFKHNEISISSLEEYYKEIHDLDKSHSIYNHIKEFGELPKEYQEQDNNTGTELVDPNSKQMLVVIQEEALQKKKILEGVERFVKAEMEIQRRKLEAVRSSLNSTITIFRKKIERIFKVIQTIELYLGVDEDLVQIQKGETAKEDVPISFRQSILYMDEEVGIWENGGIDYRDVDKFEDWLLTNKNYEKVLPEEKGVVVFKPRRFYKSYGDPMTDKQFNEWNKHTYFLIRNGENIYRIDSGNIELSERLFPLRTELQDMLKNMAEIKWEYDKEKAQDEFDNLLGQYKKLAFLMQGLIDRTEVFNPMPKRISIFKMEENPNAVQFIYDDEMLLPTGKLAFWNWVKEMNSTIEIGSRVYNTGKYSDIPGSYASKQDFYDRILGRQSVPNLPESGVYTVIKGPERIKTETYPHYYVPYLEKMGLLIENLGEVRSGFSLGYEKHSTNYQNVLNIPIETVKREGSAFGDEYIKAIKCKVYENNLFIKYRVREWWGNSYQKNKVSFEIYRDDRFIINYDRMDVEEIDFYIHSRVDRKNYFFLMPLLKGIKQRLLEEQKQENQFIEFLWEQSKRKGIKANEVKLKKFAVELVDWWKYKVNQKRPISNDDSKAMRMIERRLFAKSNKKKIS